MVDESGAEWLERMRTEHPELEGVDAAAAAEADREAEMARRLNQREVVSGAGVPPRDLVEGMLGTPQGDEWAHTYGFDLGDFSREQIMAMHKSGMSWAEIYRLCMARRRASGR